MSVMSDSERIRAAEVPKIPSLGRIKLFLDPERSWILKKIRRKRPHLEQTMNEPAMAKPREMTGFEDMLNELRADPGINERFEEIKAGAPGIGLRERTITRVNQIIDSNSTLRGIIHKHEFDELVRDVGEDEGVIKALAEAQQEERADKMISDDDLFKQARETAETVLMMISSPAKKIEMGNLLKIKKDLMKKDIGRPRIIKKELKHAKALDEQVTKISQINKDRLSAEIGHLEYVLFCYDEYIKAAKKIFDKKETTLTASKVLRILSYTALAASLISLLTLVTFANTYEIAALLKQGFFGGLVSAGFFYIFSAGGKQKNSLILAIMEQEQKELALKICKDHLKQLENSGLS